MKLSDLAALTLLVSAAAHTQAVGKRTASTCLDLRDPNISATGILKEQAAAETTNVPTPLDRKPAMMLELPEPDCVDEEPGVAVGDSELFVDFHVTSTDEMMLKRLRGLVGRKLEITGTASYSPSSPYPGTIDMIPIEVRPSSG